MNLKELKELWYEAERRLITYKTTRADPDATEGQLWADQALWRRARTEYNRACIKYVTERINE